MFNRTKQVNIKGSVASAGNNKDKSQKNFPFLSPVKEKTKIQTIFLQIPWSWRFRNISKAISLPLWKNRDTTKAVNWEE